MIALRAPSLLITAGVVTACLAGCGPSDGNPYGLSTFSGAGSAPGTAPAVSSAASSTGSSPAPAGATPDSGPVMQIVTAPDGALTYTPADIFKEGAWVERGTIVTVTATRASVVDAAVAFMALRVQLSNTWQAGDAQLSAVASGQALQNMRDRITVQRLAQRRSVGPFTLNLASVDVSGSRAAVSGCSFDGTVEVSALGSVLNDAAGGVELQMDLERRGDQWRVTTFPTEKTFCKGPGQ